MVSDRLRRVPRLLVRGLVALVLLSILGSLAFAPFAGRYLVREDPLQHADAILVLAGARVERWLEAVQLYKEGWAPTIVLSRGQVEPAESTLKALGLRYPDDAELARGLMLQMQIPADAIQILPPAVDNTAQEAAALDVLAGSSRWTRLIVVTSKYHTRRTGFAFRREFAATPVRLVIRASRYDPSKPERWWSYRRDVRMVTSELQKMLAYRLGLGT